MGKPSAPAAVDYKGLAAQQAVDNKELAQYTTGLNRVNQTGPNGSVTWSSTPGTNGGPDQWTQSTTLSPEQQALQTGNNTLAQSKLGLANSVAQGMAKDYQPISTAGLPAWSTMPIPSSVNGQPAATPTLAQTTQAWTGSSGGGSNPSQVASSSGYAGVQSGAPAYQAPAPTAAAPASNIQRTLDLSGVKTALPTTIDDTSRQRVEDALMSRLNPQLQRDNDSLRNRLLNSGIEVGTDAYNREMNNFGQQSNDARMQAILAGGQEETRQTNLLQGLNKQQFDQALATGQFGQNADITNANNASQEKIGAGHDSATLGSASTMASASMHNNDTSLAQRAKEAEFNQALQSAGFNNATRSQGLQEQMAIQNQGLNYLNGLAGGTQVQMPQFQSYYTGGNAGQSSALDAGIAGGNAANAQYQQQVSGYNGLMGGIASLGSAALMSPVGTFAAFSDVRLKKNLQVIGQHPIGIPRYSWDWKDGSGSDSGVLAQDLQLVAPQAVCTMPNGYFGVRYDMIGGK